MAGPKTIQLFLMDGTGQGRMKATLRNWTGITYLLPRTDIHLSKDRKDLKQTGVYLLFGEDDEGTPKVYIGQARLRKNEKGVLGRIMEHLGDERLDYWTHAIALVTSDDSFGPTEISYLENRFVNMAIKASRYTVTNSNDPSVGRVTEEKQAELDEFITYARLVIGALGYRVFEPVDDAKDPETKQSASPPLSMSIAGAEAKGRQTNDGFVVLAGAKLRHEASFTPSAPKSVRKNRSKHADKIGPNSILIQDIQFSSPTAAAEFVGGASLNGLDMWKNSAGKSLKQLERE